METCPYCGLELPRRQESQKASGPVMRRCVKFADGKNVGCGRTWQEQ